MLFFVSMAVETLQSQPYTLGPSGTGIDIFLVIIVLLVARRVYRGINGIRFSYPRVLRIPVVYTILTVFYSALLPLQYLLYPLVLIAMGALLGLLFGSSVQFFRRDQQLMYKRSPVIMSVWLAAFIARVAIDLAFPQNLTAAVVVTLLLGVTSGLVIGEAFHIIRQYREDYASQISQLPPDQNA